jgi:hypothetical protein
MAIGKKSVMRSARSLQEAASAGNSLQGYAAVNDPTEHEEIARLAYSYYLERGSDGGSAEEDWLRAEREVRARKGPDRKR